jgi:hypothetical protein
MRPPADASEEVPLARSSDVCGGEVNDGAPVDGALGDVAMGAQILQPVGGERVVLVVEGWHELPAVKVRLPPQHEGVVVQPLERLRDAHVFTRQPRLNVDQDIFEAAAISPLIHANIQLGRALLQLADVGHEVRVDSPAVAHAPPSLVPTVNEPTPWSPTLPVTTAPRVAGAPAGASLWPPAPVAEV